MPPTLAAAALPAGAALLAAACGGEDFIDTGTAEREIERSLERQTGVEVASVACPDDVKAREGERFRCVATGKSGREATIVVSQIDDDGNVEFRVPSASELAEPGRSGRPVQPEAGE